MFYLGIDDTLGEAETRARGRLAFDCLIPALASGASASVLSLTVKANRTRLAKLAGRVVSARFLAF